MIYVFSAHPEVVSRVAAQLGLQTQVITKEQFSDFARNYTPIAGDIGIVYDFGLFIPAELIKRLILVNVHFSLLPRHRGAIPVEAAILAGDKTTGISIQYVVEKMDEGDLILSKEVQVPENCTAGELKELLYSYVPEMIKDLLNKPVDKWNRISQNDEPTYCYKKWLERNTARIDFSKESAETIVRKINAFNPNPYAWTEFTFNNRKKVVNLLRASIHEEITDQNTPFLFIKNRGVVIKCKTGSILLSEMVIEGQKKLQNGELITLKGQLKSVTK